MNEHEFDDLFGLGGSTAEQEKKMAGAIQKGIRRQITYRVVAVILVLTLGISAALWGLSTAMNLVFYNPTKGNNLRESYAESDVGDFDILMNTYIGLVLPGYYTLPSNNDKVSKGFARYEFEMDIKENPRHIAIGGTNFRITVNMGKFTCEALGDSTISLVLDTFYNPGKSSRNDKEYLTIDDRILKDINELPDSAVLTVCASFDRTKTADEAADFMLKYSQAEYEWVGVDDPHFYYQGATSGINLLQIARHSYSDEAKEKYPGLADDFLEYDKETEEYIDSFTAERLTNAYVASLKLLIDNPKFTNGIFECLPYEGLQNIKNQYEQVVNYGIKVCCLRMRIKKNDLLAMIEEGAIDYLYVYDVALSRLEQ